MDSTIGERERVLEMINGAWICQAIAAACELGVADRLASGASAPAELARELNLAPDALRRLLRALASLGLVTEGAEEASLTASGQLLATGAEGSLRDWALMNGSRGWAAWGHLRTGLRTGRNIRAEAGFAAFGELEGDEAGQFNRAMIDLTRPVAAALAESDLFSGVKNVVDVGGGAGHLVVPVLARHPHLQAVVFDLPHARQLAEHTFREAGVDSRCRFIAGNFFEGIPPGGDVYLLKSVVHNWPDDRALDILRHCRQAMRDGARLLVIERILAESATDSALDRENARSDLQMMLACDGRERTDREFNQLLRAAGFEREGTRPLTSLIHAIAAVAA